MKFAAKKFHNFAVLAAVLSAVLLSGCAKLEDNMAASRKEHLVPGKQIHLDNMRSYQFCEVALITGTTKGNAIADFYNSTGTDDCTPERFAGLDEKQIIKETGARTAFLNPSRHWMFDKFDVYEDGVDRTFGGIKMTWMGVVPVEQLEKAVTKGHYVPGYIYRDNHTRSTRAARSIFSTRRRRSLRHAVLHQLRPEGSDHQQHQGSRPQAHPAARLEIPLCGPRSRTLGQPEKNQQPRPRLPGRLEERLSRLRRRQGL